MYKLPDPSDNTSVGKLNPAPNAGMSSPLYRDGPMPATVEIVPATGEALTSKLAARGTLVLKVTSTSTLREPRGPVQMSV
jgi:hypothetical protein